MGFLLSWSWAFLSLGSWFDVFHICAMGFNSIKCHKPQPGPGWLVFTTVFYLTSQGFILDLAKTFECFFCLLVGFKMPDQGVWQIVTYNIKFQLLDRLKTQPTNLLKYLHCGVILLLHLRWPTSVPQMATGSQHFPAAGIQHLQVLPVTFGPELLPVTSTASEVSSSVLGVLFPHAGLFACFLSYF